jgi:hypothetical protein
MEQMFIRAASPTDAPQQTQTAAARPTVQGDTSRIGG